MNNKGLLHRWLESDDIFRRAISIYLHVLLGYLLLGLVIFVPITILVLLFQ